MQAACSASLYYIQIKAGSDQGWMQAACSASLYYIQIKAGRDQGCESRSRVKSVSHKCPPSTFTGDETLLHGYTSDHGETELETY